MLGDSLEKLTQESPIGEDIEEKIVSKCRELKDNLNKYDRDLSDMYDEHLELFKDDLQKKFKRVESMKKYVSELEEMELLKKHVLELRKVIEKLSEDTDEKIVGKCKELMDNLNKYDRDLSDMYDKHLELFNENDLREKLKKVESVKKYVSELKKINVLKKYILVLKNVTDEI